MRLAFRLAPRLRWNEINEKKCAAFPWAICGFLGSRFCRVFFSLMGNKQLGRISPFSIGLGGGDIEILKKVWPTERWPLDVCNEYGQSILHAAVASERNDVLQLCLAYGVDIHIRDKIGGLKAFEYEGKSGILLREALQQKLGSSEATATLTEEGDTKTQGSNDFEVDSDFGEYMPSTDFDEEGGESCNNAGNGDEESSEEEGEEEEGDKIFGHLTEENLRSLAVTGHQDKGLLGRLYSIETEEVEGDDVSVRTSEATTVKW